MRTSEIAKAVGVHPNTVRLYEQWGFLRPAVRGANGYRAFTDAHLRQMRLAWTALHGGWPGRSIRRSALSLVRQCASGDLPTALEQAYQHLALVQAERVQAEAAASFLERWARGAIADQDGPPMNIGRAAAVLDLTIDTLRSWERNGLVRPPRSPGGYRLYGPPDIGRLRVIRMLYRGGYSTMALLRMLTCLERDGSENLRAVLDTPRPDEDVLSASDSWITSLAEQEDRACRMIGMIEEMMRKAAE
jgi:DNA-binding transcriptional MerR regulator